MNKLAKKSTTPVTDMNKAFFLKVEERTPNWQVIDATDEIVGRLATKIADILRGKNKPSFTKHTDGGDYVVVINATKVKFTGDKWDKKIYDWHTGWMGGYKTLTAQEMMKKHPEAIIMHAVKGMLPKNKLARQLLKKLKIYVTKEHPHTAQVATSKAAEAA
ncbi:MAG: 50S ribosomal protein L13 [Candidatus Babeliaceae bacterium]